MGAPPTRQSQLGWAQMLEGWVLLGKSDQQSGDVVGVLLPQSGAKLQHPDSLHLSRKRSYPDLL